MVGGFLVAQTVKRLPTVQETRVRSLGLEDPPAKEMVTHSSILAWKIPWTVGFPSRQMVKNVPVMQEIWVRFLGQEDPLEKRRATHSSIPAWEIPGQRSLVGSQRVGHD